MSNPASPYLHDRLQARRANNTTRLCRSDSVPHPPHLPHLEDIFLKEAQSQGPPSFATPPSNRMNSNVTPSASLGAREMEKRMDRLSKLNFDLKMEIFHCRERMDKMQEELNAMASLAGRANNLSEENAALLEINDSLVKELEHRDEAVQEAVAIICDLEEKLQRTNELSQCRTAFQETPLQLSNVQESSTDGYPCLSTPQGLKTDSQTMVSKPKRVPSFVVDKKASTRALRSVYLEPTQALHAVKSYASLVSHREDLDKSVSDVDSMHSPCLSVLSESSFPSIYDLPRAAITDHKDQPHAHVVHGDGKLPEPSPSKGGSDRSSESRNSWVRVQTPQPSGKIVLENPQHELSDSNKLKPVAPVTGDNDRKDRFLRGNLAFGGALLPPTPESVSTSLLQESYMDHTGVRKAHGLLANLENTAEQTSSDTSAASAIADAITPNSRSQKRAPMSGEMWSNRHSVALSSTDEEDESDRPNSSTESYEQDYPSGKSIHTGTPSRFQLRHTTTQARDLMFNGDELARAPRPRDQRRNTSAEKHHNPVLKPTIQAPNRQRMERSETTPNLSTNSAVPRQPLRKSSFDATERQMLIESGLLPEMPVVRKSHLDDHPPSLVTSQSQQRKNSETTISSTQNKAQSHATLMKPQPRQFDEYSTQATTGTTGFREALSQRTHRLLRRHRDGRRSSDIGTVPASPQVVSRPQQVVATNEYIAAITPGSRSSSTMRGIHNPTTRPTSSGEELLAVQAASQALRTEAVAKAATFSPGGSRSLFRRRGSVRR